MSWPAAFLSGPAAATGIALINSCGSVGGFAGPFLLGALADDSSRDGYSRAMLVLGVLLGVAAVLVLGEQLTWFLGRTTGGSGDAHLSDWIWSFSHTHCGVKCIPKEV